MSYINRCIALVIGTVLLSACQDEGFFQFNNFTVENIQSEVVYAGFHNAPPPIDTGKPQLPENITISYSDVPEGLNVFLNGQRISQHFDIGAYQASAPMSSLNEFLREGENLLAVEPFKFGPNIKFYADTRGPEIIVKSVIDVRDDTPSFLEPSIKAVLSVKDAADVTSVTLQGGEASKVDGLYEATATPASTWFHNSYRIKATDASGYETNVRYLLDGTTIEDAIKVRVDEEIISNLKPIISEGISSIDMNRAELLASGMRSDWIDGGNLLLAVIWVKLFGLKIGNAELVSFDIDPASINHNANEGTAKVKVRLATNVGNGSGAETAVKVDLQTAGSVLTCFCYGTYLSRPRQPTDQWAGMTGPNDMTLFITSVVMDGDVKFSIIDGKLTVTPIHVDLALGTIVGQPTIAVGLVNIMKDILNFVFVDIFVKTVENGLSKIRIANTVTNDTGQKFELVTKATHVSTKDDKSLFTTYEGKFDVIDGHPDVALTLGSYFVPGDVPEVISNESVGAANGVAVTVNSNLINQGLSTLYKIGMTHISVIPSELTDIDFTAPPEELSESILERMYFGPNAIDDNQGVDGDMKIELIPRTPGTITFKGDETSQASLSYTNAKMIISKKEFERWKVQFEVEVDISAGVLMDVIDQKFNITIQGTPEVTINSMVNNTPLPVPDAFVKPILDILLNLATPLLSSTSQTLTLPVLENEGFGYRTELTTQGLDTKDGHLRFNSGANAVAK